MENKKENTLRKPAWWQKPVIWQIPVSYIIDFFLISMVMLGCLLVMFCALYNPNLPPENIVNGTKRAILFSPLFYYGISETWKGSSLGKMAMALAVSPRSFTRILIAYVLDYFWVGLFSFISYRTFPNVPFVIFIYLWLGIDFVIIEGITNASLGKWICKLRVYQKQK